MSYIFTKEELEILCKEWQATLGMSEWEIAICISRDNDMSVSGQGCNKVTPAKKIAFIYIVDPIDYPIYNESSIWPQDMERTLVHELIHIHMYVWDNIKPDSVENILLEQTVDTLSKALVNLKRGTNNEQCS